jgi:Uma2 family endonuclease
METHIKGSGYDVYQDFNLIHGRKVCIPDLFIGPEDPEDIPDEEGLGVDATRVPLVVEVVSPGRDAHQRDHERKRRFYATAGVPIYVIIDDYDNEGTVTVLTEPDPGNGIYAAVTHAPYGKRVVIQDGPAKLFTFDEKITAA